LRILSENGLRTVTEYKNAFCLPTRSMKGKQKAFVFVYLPLTSGLIEKLNLDVLSI
jgi:hypothetical protein